MIDQKKRQTLKAISAVAGSTIVAALPTTSIAAPVTSGESMRAAQTVRQVWPPVVAKTPIQLSTRFSAEKNITEVILTNTSQQPVNLTQLTPSKLGTPSGTFDLEKLLEQGHRHLAAGESIGVRLDTNSLSSAADSLQPIKMTGLSVSTDADVFSAVSYAVAT